MRFETISFPRRYVGPLPDWVNGGVVAGTLAEELTGGAVTVRIDRPVPVDTDLNLEVVDGMVELRDAGGRRLAFARRVEAEFLDVPQAVSPASAAATVPAVPLDGHPAPGCFVCGPLHPDGLNLQPGPVDGTGTIATVMMVSDQRTTGRAELPSPIVWAAMDCPGWYVGCDGQMALLGSITAEQFEPLEAGEQVVVQAWDRGVDGRKVQVGVALRRPDGRLLAVAHSIWILTPDLAA